MIIQQGNLSGRKNYNLILSFDLINRLVNMLDMTKLDQENVWKIVKKTRISFLSECLDKRCQYHNPLLINSIIEKNINILAAELNLNTTSGTNANMSNKNLQTAVEMFTYLNYCPSFIPPHALLTAYLSKTGTPREIILALTSAMKTSQNVIKKRGYQTIRHTICGYQYPTYSINICWTIIIEVQCHVHLSYSYLGTVW